MLNKNTPFTIFFILNWRDILKVYQKQPTKKCEWKRRVFSTQRPREGRPALSLPLHPCKAPDEHSELCWDGSSQSSNKASVSFFFRVLGHDVNSEMYTERPLFGSLEASPKFPEFAEISMILTVHRHRPKTICQGSYFVHKNYAHICRIN